MKTISLSRHLLISALLTCSFNASASNLKWLEYAPTSKFTQTDWDIAKNAAKKALNDADDGETISWKNDQSGNNGTLTPLNSREQNGKPCRDLKIHNNAGSLSGNASYTFCKQADGRWKTDQAKL